MSYLHKTQLNNTRSKSEKVKKEIKGKCKQGFKVEVLNNVAGYYIGTLDEEGFPNCRLSVEYYKTEESAQHALDNKMFIEREAVEIMFCKGGHGNCY